MRETEVIEITGIAAGGAGVGRLADGRVTFVHRTAPGEAVEVRLREEHGSWTRSDLMEVRRPSSRRRSAPCPHYDRCGGCTLEHLHYGAQLEAKRGIVQDALERIGGLELDVPAVVPSPREFGYRNRASYTLLRLGGERVVAGFHELERPGRIVDVTDCLLPEPAVTAAWAGIRRGWGQGARWLPAGKRLRLTVRATADGRASLLVDGGHGTGRPDRLLDAVDTLDAVWHRPDGAASAERVAGSDLAERWRREEVALDGTAFLQVNRSAAEPLEQHVYDTVRAAGPASVVDAYCGVGLHGRHLAREGLDVVGIDADAEAVEEARRGCPEGRFVHGLVEDRIGETLPADVVILNPPRAGLADEVPRALAARPPERLVYVSCDPATLARDLERLAPAFRPSTVRCFDLFPQTSHVETVAELACATT